MTLIRDPRTEKVTEVMCDGCGLRRLPGRDLARAWKRCGISYLMPVSGVERVLHRDACCDRCAQRVCESLRRIRDDERMHEIRFGWSRVTS